MILVYNNVKNISRHFNKSIDYIESFRNVRNFDGFIIANYIVDKMDV